MLGLFSFLVKIKIKGYNKNVTKKNFFIRLNPRFIQIKIQKSEFHANSIKNKTLAFNIYIQSTNYTIMAVPKKRTSKAKKNKRKAVWKQKASAILVRYRSQEIVTRKWGDMVPQLIGFKPELRYKCQPSDQLNSKRPHFMEDEVQNQLQNLVGDRLAFNAKSPKEQDQEIINRIRYTAISLQEKDLRVYNNKNRKEVARKAALAAANSK